MTNAIHESLHDYEGHMAVFSGVMLALGWAVQIFSWKIDCHDTGCHHGPCEPRKHRVSKILWVASALFVINLIALSFFH